MKKELETISNHWHVVGTLKIDSSEWTQNVHVGVDAMTMQTALETAAKIYPGIRFISCQHRRRIIGSNLGKDENSYGEVGTVPNMPRNNPPGLFCVPTVCTKAQ